MHCSTCNLVIEVSDKEGDSTAKDHLQSDGHENPKAYDHDFQKFKLNVINIDGATTDVIAFCQRLNNKSAFCLVCEISIPKSPTGIANHLKTLEHKRKSGKLPVKQSVNNILSENPDHFEKVSNSKTKCNVCNVEFSTKGVSNLDRHLNSKIHKGILAENNDESLSVPFSYSDEDPFFLRRQKQKRQAVIEQIPEESTDCITVKYDIGTKTYNFFCIHCKETVFGGKKIVGDHVKKKKHLKNVPNEKGHTQSGFEYDLTKMCMASK